MKTWKLLNSEIEYRKALSKAFNGFPPEPGTLEYEEREFLLVLIKDYEERHLAADPVRVN
jgi:HTH-type transcriptional regulator / antitoxin HigA